MFCCKSTTCTCPDIVRLVQGGILLLICLILLSYLGIAENQHVNLAYRQ